MYHTNEPWTKRLDPHQQNTRDLNYALLGQDGTIIGEVYEPLR